MSTSGETADLMVRESIQITESAVKLAGLGAKNLAALLLAVANDQQKVAGKTNLKRLIQSGEEIALFSVKAEDLARFQKESKRYGVLYCPIINKAENTGMVEIMARARDVRQINHVLEQMGYLAKEVQKDSEKKSMNRVLSDRSFGLLENGVTDSHEAKGFMDKTERKQSVKKKLSEYKTRIEQKEMEKIKERKKEVVK